MERPTIGPYRIEERLGAGGMGEVFLAYDERLDRRVAVKRIRREALASDEARRRFRREARAAARLSHPAIVQIHDILEDEEGDSLVMERVHGQSLTRLLTEGPLGVGVVVDLARQIAEGLAAAHAEGIVHRDLKTDNVMVTHEGRVKILDFGLAKQLTRAETDLSVAGKIVGTVHAMSPEQAQGFEVDPRSDLFSLGSLLYRALTGRSPFRSASPVQTLTRIATFRQPPVREIEPRVPEALSDLVDHLLEKDPLYRPESAAAVAASLAEIAAEVETGARAAADERAKSLIESETATIARSPTLVGSPQGTADIRPTDPRRQRRAAGWAVALPLLCLGLVAIVWTLFDKRPEQLDAAVLPPQIDEASTHPEPALVGSAVRLALIRGLHSLEGLATAAPDEVDQVTGPASEVARALGVDEAITTRLSCQPRACWVEVHRVAAVDGRTRWSNRFQVFPGDLLELDAVVGGRLQNSYRDRRPLVGAVLEVAPEDYETFLRLRRAWQTRSGPPSAELLAAVAQLHSTSPRFVEAYLLEARIAQGLFVASGQAADLDRALTAVRRAREVAPGDPRALFDLFNIALDGGRLQGADEALAALRRAEPGHGRLLAQQALLREARGQKGEALAEMRAAAERHPSWRNLMDLARMEIRLGELEAAGERLRQLLERDPDNDLALFLLARHELTYGDLEQAARLFETLSAVAPSDPGRRLNLALARFGLGRYAQAAAGFEAILAIEPEHLRATAALALTRHLLGEAAAQALAEKALELSKEAAGVADADRHFLRAMALVALDRGAEAVAAMQQIPPDEGPFTAWQAALIYALVGEELSARSKAREALDDRLSPQWFAAPVFDRFRDDLELSSVDQ